MIRIAALLLFVLAALYLLLPSPQFPKVPPDSVQSAEPADTESIYRRAYFTSLSRQELVDYYFGKFGGWGIRLVHPPEEAQTLIRDQTRSSWLEEIVHPGRESVYINAFVPTLPTDQINIDGVHYLNKVTVRYQPSSPLPRLTVLVMVSIVIYFMAREYDVVKV